MKRRLLILDPPHRRWRLETLDSDALAKDPREDYFLLTGEALCQYMLRRDPRALVIARGPMPFLSGNKATVGYLSPLTGLPHYSIVGGRVAAQLLNLGLDAICFQPVADDAPADEAPYVTVGGWAPDLDVAFHPEDGLPCGQRSAYYWLVARELGGQALSGSVLTLGEGARLGYGSANVAAEAIYHAGRGGAGLAFAQYAAALVLRGQPVEPAQFFDPDEAAFARNPNGAIEPLVRKHCARLSSKTGGTVAKLYATGADPAGRNTLPAANARRLGYAAADLGSPRILQRTRQGQTGCHWCQVDCRHYHWVAADYAPGGRDMLLDDFEPTYAIHAMLNLAPREDSLQGRLDLLAAVDEGVMLPIEELGCDALNIGLGLAALDEGLARGLIPPDDAPPALRPGATPDALQRAAEAVAMLRYGYAADYPALRAVGDGPQALAERYAGMQDVVFTSGRGTLGNPGHSNALWTFLLPFSRYFGHYVGQLYKIEAEMPPPGASEDAYRACFQQVVRAALQRECFWLIGNALSQCAFTFIIYSQDGAGERLADERLADEALADDGLLARLLRHYGVRTTADELRWFSQAFWAQSIDLKCQHGWRPPGAADLPQRVYASLALALGRPAEELRGLMALLIDEWKTQARALLERFGYAPDW
ncbi:MAG: aldehyde ferredoxin oxidoreductase N-terminal domain-containing protein [Chloroflexota bacterium]